MAVMAAAAGCQRAVDDPSYTDRVVRWRAVSFTFSLPAALSETNSVRDAMIRRSIPTSNDVLGGFYSNEPLHFAAIAGFRPNRDVTAKPRDFIQQREVIKSQMAQAVGLGKQTVAAVEARLAQSRAAGLPVPDVTLEQPLFLGVHDESDRHFSALMLVGITTETPDGASRRVVVGCTSMLYLKGKILTLELYRPFEGPATYEQIKAEAKIAVQQTLRRNPP
jgi:hypothetical protein